MEKMYKYTNCVDYPIRYTPSRKGKREMKKTSLDNLVVGYKTLGVSESTRKKIAQHIKMLSLLSVERTVRRSNGNYCRHRNMFITLTLPAEQVHTDTEITKICLGSFLDRCRKLGILTNYVWRAEKQKNGNIHYHIITDTFCNFSLIKNLWHLSLEKLGYISVFQRKFIAMPFDVYKRLDFNSGVPIQKVAGAYAHGVRTKWRNPPTTQVDYITNASELSLYLSKYVGKQDKEKENIVQGRVWSCSSSVSTSLKEFKSNQEINQFWYMVGAEMMRREVITHDFFSICLFSFKSLVAWFVDVRQSVLALFRTIFYPCQFWRNSVGMFTPT